MWREDYSLILYASGGMVGLERSIKTSNVPAGVQIVLAVHFDRVSINPVFSSSGPFVVTESSRVEGAFYRIDGDLYLNSNGTTWIRGYFNPDGVREKKEDAVEDLTEAESDETGPMDNVARGKMLLGENDCAACHTMVAKQIGPSFVEVALKYDDSEETRNQLAAKIRSGGQGVWGQRPMAAHPFLGTRDAQAIAAFILSLD